MLYAADVWLTPIHILMHNNRDSGSVTVIRRLATVQRVATGAIMGGTYSTAMDTMDAHALCSRGCGWPEIHTQHHSIEQFQSYRTVP
jgi:hypothetical protein